MEPWLDDRSLGAPQPFGRNRVLARGRKWPRARVPLDAGLLRPDLVAHRHRAQAPSRLVATRPAEGLDLDGVEHEEVGALRAHDLPVEVWAAPSPCGLGSRSIARAEGPSRPSPAMRVSGLTADDRCRGSLRLAVAHHCGRRGCGWSSRLPAREHNGSRRSHRTDQLARSSTAIIGGRPSWRTRADRVRSIGTAPDWPCDFNLCSPPPNSLRLRRVVQAASARIVIAPRGRHGLTILSTNTEHIDISAVQAGCTRANRFAYWDRPGLAMRTFQLTVHSNRARASVRRRPREVAP